MHDKNKGIFKSIFGSIIKIFEWIKNLPRAFFTVNLSHNTWTKLFSLVLAISFWVYVMDQVDPEITKIYENIPVQLINLQEVDQNNLIIMNEHDYFVNVEVVGRRNNVINLNSKSIYLWADMRGVKKGINTLQINKSINSEAVSINLIFPNDIVLQVDQIVSLPKPIKVQINGDYQAAVFQEQLVINPDEIKITGPESLVNTVNYLGGSVNVSNLTEDLLKDISLVPYNYDGEIVNGVTLDSNYTNVSLKLGKTKNVELKAIVEGKPKEGYEIVSVKTIPAFINVKGDINLINEFNTLEIEQIDMNGDEESTFIIEKDLTYPKGISASTEIGPIQIEVQIEAIQTKDFTFYAKDLPIVNLQDNLTTNLLDNEDLLTVRVKDVESIIKELSLEDIHLTLNFSNVDKPGIYRMKLVLSDEDRFKEIMIDPIYVEVNVIEKSTENSN